MLILGKDKDDKGAQLELLTHQLLTTRGCVNVRTKEIGAGGLEIDVTADAPIPGLGQQQVQRVICESKAHRSPIGTTQWLKFLGKIFVDKELYGDEVTGYFIALSGVNGNVAGNYKILRSRTSNIVLLDGEDLLAEISALYPLSALNDVDTNLRRLTNRSVREYDVAYYDRKIYRVVVFEDDAYTLLDGNGQPMPVNEKLEGLKGMLQDEIAVKAFIDLPQEAEARRRDVCAQMALLSQLILDDGATSPSRVLTEVSEIAPCTSDEIDRAITTTEEVGWVKRYPNGEVRFTEPPTPQEKTRQFVEVITFLASRKPEGACDARLFLRVLGCSYYDAHINRRLVSYIQTVQADLPLAEEDVNKVIELCRLSPSALLHATQPDPNLVVHRTDFLPKITNEEKDRFNEWGRSYVLRTLYNCLITDFRRAGPRSYFYEKRELREIETVQIVRVKNQTRVELEDTLSERRAIIELADEFLAPDGGGKYATVLALTEGNPWSGNAEKENRKPLNES